MKEYHSFWKVESLCWRLFPIISALLSIFIVFLAPLLTTSFPIYCSTFVGKLASVHHGNSKLFYPPPPPFTTRHRFPCHSFKLPFRVLPNRPCFFFPTILSSNICLLDPSSSSLWRWSFRTFNILGIFYKHQIVVSSFTGINFLLLSINFYVHSFNLVISPFLFW